LTRRLHLWISLGSFLLTPVWAQPPSRDHVINRLVVQRRNGANPNNVNQVLGANGAVTVAQIPQINVLVLQVPEQAADRVAAALERSGQFTFVERDYLARTFATPSDPYFPSQWHLSTIQAPSAWDRTTGAAGITIGMIDSGVESTHPDLSPKLVTGWNFTTGTSVTGDNTGHGTATAGTAGAATNNGAGVAGVAWTNPIMPLVVVDSSGNAMYSNMASAITYAADHGVRVMNMSLAGPSGSSTLQSAINYAWNKGSIVVASAGNYGTSTPYYPAACDNVVAVSATDSNDAIASFSNFGSWIDLAAPGASILTTSTGGSYGSWSGTSFSAPIVAGVAALVLSAKPSLSPNSLVSLLEQNSDDLGASGYDIYYGYGRVNAYKAVTAALGSSSIAPPSVSITSPTNGSTVSGTVAVPGTATSSLTINSVQLLVDSQQVLTVSAAPFSFSWDSTAFANGNHTLTVKAYDTAGNVGSASVAVSVNNVAVVDSQAPTIVITKPSSGGTVSGNISIAASASDNVGVTQVSFYVDGILKSTDVSAPYTCTWNSRKVSSGPHTIKATAWDAAGNSTSASINVTK
jgi:subtilisin family serine protease